MIVAFVGRNCRKCSNVCESPSDINRAGMQTTFAHS